MTRVRTGNVARTRRKKILKQAKGYFGSKHRLYRTAKEQVGHSLAYAYRDRKQNKRNFRKLWITRINAACRLNNITYSQFISGLKKAELLINRKMLAEIAYDQPAVFSDLVEIANLALQGKEYKPKAVKIEQPIVEKKTTTVKPAKKAVKVSAVKKSVTTTNKQKKEDK